jgi:hypothetical protein
VIAFICAAPDAATESRLMPHARIVAPRVSLRPHSLAAPHLVVRTAPRVDVFGLLRSRSAGL